MSASPEPRHRAWARFVVAQTLLLERIEAAFAEAALPPLAWYDVLWVLDDAAGGRLRMHDLASKAVVSRSNVTRLTDRMEKAGLVARSDCPLDGRGTVCELTAKGRALRGRMWPVYRKQIDALFGKHLGAREAGRAPKAGTMERLGVRLDYLSKELAGKPMAAQLPTLFISHGSPMHALEPGAVRGVWENLGRTLPRPKAILIASAHWETDLPALTGSARPETIHDFYGFPKPLYQIQYPAPGAPDTVLRAIQLLEKQNLKAVADARRGLDHGAWSPLLHMYPQADVPVVQVSVQTELGPKHHLVLGRALAPLSDEGVLILGSGHLTHNLRERSNDGPAAYVREFQDWVKQRIDRHALDELADYRKLTPGGVRAHPTDEHFLPLFVALGAARESYKAERLYDGIEMGALAMDAYLFR